MPHWPSYVTVVAMRRCAGVAPARAPAARPPSSSVHDDLVADRGHAHLESRPNERADDVRAGVRLARAGRALDREHVAVELERDAARGVYGRLVRPLQALPAASSSPGGVRRNSSSIAARHGSPVSNPCAITASPSRMSDLRNASDCTRLWKNTACGWSFAVFFVFLMSIVRSARLTARRPFRPGRPASRLTLVALARVELLWRKGVTVQRRLAPP